MAKVGVLFSNLGTPKSTDPDDVGNYLGEFLMDPYVIQVPFIIRYLLVKKIIVPRRKSFSAENYKKVWTENGSPLLVETQKAADALQSALGNDYKVVVGMRYGEPSFEAAKQQLSDCEKIIFFPQYPQYAASTVQTGLDYFDKYFNGFKTQVIEPYYEQKWFIEAYVQFLKEKWGSQFDHLLMSFHGLPVDHIVKSDKGGQHCYAVDNCCEKASGEVLKYCYRAQCFKTAEKIAQGLSLDKDSYSVSFQSRLGRQKWIEPYTENQYKKLVDQGVKRLAVICPGFSVDGLETLEEIAMEGKETFLEAGGQEFQYLPCLNDSEYWIQACADMIRKG